MSHPLPGRSTGAVLRDRVVAERARLEREAAVDMPPIHHYRRPSERPFTAAERERTTLLFGGLTRVHEQLIRAAFRGCGYRCQRLPTPNRPVFELGKEYGNNGWCNPAYFTIGSLIYYLQRLEAHGLSRRQIVDRYVFFTAGSCGPCRFGMYESEYRLALQHAGFEGFRVLLFQQSQGVRQVAEEAGLRYSIDFGLRMLKALYLGDLLNDLGYQIRPYEVRPGQTAEVLDACAHDLCEALRTQTPVDVLEHLPGWMVRWMNRALITRLGKIYQHLYGRAFIQVVRACRDRLDEIEVDRTRPKAIVKITGEFWAQTTEGDGNYRMFEFLEREGAQVLVEPIGTWATYLLHHAKLRAYARWKQGAVREPGWRGFRRHGAAYLRFLRRQWLFAFGEWLYAHHFHRLNRVLGGLADRLVPQRVFARLADPFYKPLVRGGEGHLEVAKNIYYSAGRRCHMVLSLKPFGCMPSSQSDGVQSAVVTRFKGMIFLPVETSGEGEINALSRVQMALGEAKVKAAAEFERVLQSTHKRLDDIRAYVAERPELRRPLSVMPHRSDVAGVAARFLLHVSALMDRHAPRTRP